MNSLYQRLKELSKDDFEALIDQLLQAKYPAAGIALAEGAGGDEGIDNFQGGLADGPAVWQHKHFPNRIQGPQQKRVMKSIKAAFKNRTPRLWVLCVPIKLRTNEHNWFQQTVKAPYERKYRGTTVELMQASHIVRDLLHYKTIRDIYFPDSVSDISRLKQMATSTENLKPDDRALLATEYAQQFLSTLKSIDARFDYEVSIGGERCPLARKEPGLVIAFKRGELLTKVFARDINAIRLDPIGFKIGLDKSGHKKRHTAINTGHPQILTSNEIVGIESSSPLFNFIAAGVTPAQITLTPLVPNPDSLIPLRIVFGKGENAKEIRYLAFRKEYVGRREITIRSVSHLPLDVVMVLRFEGESSFNIAPVLDHADVRELRSVIECFEALRRSPFIEISSVEFNAPLLAGEVPFSSSIELEEGLVQVIYDAAIVADRFGVSLKLPSVISDDDLNALLQLRRIATGEEFEAGTISATMAKDRSLQEGILSGSNKWLAPLRFEPQSDAYPIEIFGTKVSVGRPVFECTKVEIEEPSKTRERYVAASDGDSIPIVWRCLERCRFFYGSPLNPLAQNNPPIDRSSGANSIPRTDR